VYHDLKSHMPFLSHRIFHQF